MSGWPTREHVRSYSYNCFAFAVDCRRKLDVGTRLGGQLAGSFQSSERNVSPSIFLIIYFNFQMIVGLQAFEW